MPFVPTAQIYASNNTTPIYNLGNMLGIEGWPNTSNPKSITVSNLRSLGELIISEGDSAYDITITGRISAADYTALITAWNTLQTAIVANTPYYLHIDKSVSSTDDIKVKRIQKIEIISTNNMNTWLYYKLVLRANSWA